MSKKKQSLRKLVCIIENCPFRKQEEETTCELEGQLSLFEENELKDLEDEEKQNITRQSSKRI